MDVIANYYEQYYVMFLNRELNTPISEPMARKEERAHRAAMEQIDGLERRHAAARKELKELREKSQKE